VWHVGPSRLRTVQQAPQESITRNRQFGESYLSRIDNLRSPAGRSRRNALGLVKPPKIARHEFNFCGFMDRPLQGLTVLVVDDDADFRKSIARILRLAGAEVSVTGSVEDALQRLEEKKWDVVVSDIGMPVLTGYELIRRARHRGHRVPMIAMTGLTRRSIDSRSSYTGSPTVSSSHMIPSTSWL
jgi:CheY-like chemotaxis protein